MQVFCHYLESVLTGDDKNFVTVGAHFSLMIFACHCKYSMSFCRDMCIIQLVRSVDFQN